MMPDRKERQRTGHKRRGLMWLTGLLCLVALVMIVLHLGEEKRFVALVRHAQPSWLLCAMTLQGGTYFCAAAIWYGVLRRTGCHQSLLSLVGLGVAKLFTDQALPSAGVGGTLLVVEALQRRGVSRGAAMAAVLVDIVTYYASFALTLAVSLFILWRHHDLHIVVLAMAGVFGLMALVIPGSIFWLTRHKQHAVPPWLQRVPILRSLLDAFRTAPPHILRDPGLLGPMVVWHVAIFLLDAGTLLAMLYTIGQPASLAQVFASFMVASLAATVGLVPGGLGTFEGALVAMLKLFGVALEPALAATLLLRGFTFWLPMLPGLWLAHREIHGRAGGAQRASGQGPRSSVC